MTTDNEPGQQTIWAAVVDEADLRHDGQVVLTGELAVTLHATEADGRDAVFRWVEDHWDRHVNAAVTLDAHAYREMPTERETAIEAYFKEIGGRAIVIEVARPETNQGFAWAAVLDEADVTYGTTVTLSGELLVTLHAEELEGWHQVRAWVEDHHLRHPPSNPEPDLDPDDPADDERAATDAYLSKLGSRAAVRPVRLPAQ